MRRLALGLMLLGALAFPAAAAAHPSENRNPEGFGEGPHCHINLQSGHLTVPSHTAHATQNELAGQGTVFQALQECPD